MYNVHTCMCSLELVLELLGGRFAEQIPFEFDS